MWRSYDILTKVTEESTEEKIANSESGGLIYNLLKMPSGAAESPSKTVTALRIDLKDPDWGS